MTDIPADLRAAMMEAVARAIADQIGDGFDNAHTDKADWRATRGMKGGRVRDVNEPRQADYLNAANAAVTALAPIIAAALAAEREACAKVIDDMRPNMLGKNMQDLPDAAFAYFAAKITAFETIAAAIRARGGE